MSTECGLLKGAREQLDSTLERWHQEFGEVPVPKLALINLEPADVEEFWRTVAVVMNKLADRAGARAAEKHAHDLSAILADPKAQWNPTDRGFRCRWGQSQALRGAQH